MDTFTGGAGSDTFVAAYNATANANTLSTMDVIDGGSGTDTLQISSDNGANAYTLAGATVSNIENITIRGSAAVTADTSGATFTGVSSLATTLSTTATLTAAGTTNIAVSGATGAVTVDGGKNVTVTHAAAGQDINIGATIVNAGTVSVTSTKMGTQSIAVDGGTSVTIVATGSSGGAVGDTITVGNGGAATDLPSGAVSVTSNHTAVASTDVCMNNIVVKGGSTIAVTQTADTSKVAADTTGEMLYLGGVNVIAGTGTTTVTSTQAAGIAKVAAVAAVAGTTETASVKFSALAAGETMVMGGLTYTVSAGKSLTANEAAAVFANLTKGTLPAAGDSQAGGPASKGTYTGVFTGWTSGAASGDTVVFTSTTANSNVTDLANTGTNGKTTITTTAGSSATTAVAGVLGVRNGTLTINDNATAASLTSVTVDGYGAGSTVGGTNNVTKLATLNLANSAAVAEVQTFTVTGAVAANGVGNITVGGVNVAVANSDTAAQVAGKITAAKAAIITGNATIANITNSGAEVTVTYTSTAGDAANVVVGAGATGATFSGVTESVKGDVGEMTVNVGAAASSLALNLNNANGTVTLTGAALKTLAVTTATADSSIALSAAAAETLTVDGTKKATFSSDLAAVKTVTVTGSASLVLSGNEDNTLTSVNTSGTTGAVTASIDGGLATYTGGAGVDTVTLKTTTALTKAINLGGGDDTLNFAALGVTGSTAAVNGGDGIDTLSMSTATADALDASAQSFYTNFERLDINNAAASATVDLANLGFTNYVTTNGSTGTLTLNNLASNGTVVIKVAPTTGFTIGIKDAATGTADVANVLVSSAGDLGAGAVGIADVETVNLTFTDTSTTTVNSDTMTLNAAAATAVTVAGNSNVNLNMGTSTAVTSINASAMTKALTVTSLNTTAATTITGGSGNDLLTAATGTTADVLIGGAGDDTLTANAGLNRLTGGTGNDMFVIGTASLTSSSYATITDFAAGDLIKMTGATSFLAAAVTQADTAVFQDFANAAINAIGANAAAWFQYQGNTYIVMDAGADTATFTNGQDFIVKLTGLVDLTNASFSSTYATIAL